MSFIYIEKSSPNSTRLRGDIVADIRHAVERFDLDAQEDNPSFVLLRDLETKSSYDAPAMKFLSGMQRSEVVEIVRQKLPDGRSVGVECSPLEVNEVIKAFGGEVVATLNF